MLRSPGTAVYPAAHPPVPVPDTFIRFICLIDAIADPDVELLLEEAGELIILYDDLRRFLVFAEGFALEMELVRAAIKRSIEALEDETDSDEDDDDPDEDNDLSDWDHPGIGQSQYGRFATSDEIADEMIAEARALAERGW